MEAEHAGPSGHGHGLNRLHVATVRVFVTVVDAGVDSVLVERVFRVENLFFRRMAVLVRMCPSRELYATGVAPVVRLLQTSSVYIQCSCVGRSGVDIVSVQQAVVPVKHLPFRVKLGCLAQPTSPLGIFKTFCIKFFQPSKPTLVSLAESPATPPVHP